MATKQPKPTPRELTADELKEIKRKVAWQITWYIVKRILLIPLIIFAFFICVVLGVSTNQIMHTLSGEHNVREQH